MPSRDFAPLAENEPDFNQRRFIAVTGTVMSVILSAGTYGLYYAKNKDYDVSVHDLGRPFIKQPNVSVTIEDEACPSTITHPNTTPDCQLLTLSAKEAFDKTYCEQALAGTVSGLNRAESMLNPSYHHEVIGTIAFGTANGLGDVACAASVEKVAN